MTNEEVIEIMEAYRDKLINSVSNQLDKDIEAFDMAIQSLSQEPCDDAISREDVEECKELMTDINGDTVYAVRMSDIRQLPPVTQKSGKWIYVLDADGFYICSECSYGNEYADNFCPWCGAKMVEPQESEE